MRRRWLALALFYTVVGGGLACGPVGPLPGGRLDGKVAGAEPPDWSFTDDVDTVQLETNPEDPHSVNCWIAAGAGSLYVPTSMIAGVDEPSEREWVQNVLADPRVRIRVDGVLYPRKAVRVTDPEELRRAREMLVAKYEVEASDDGKETRAWIFRLDPR